VNLADFSDESKNVSTSEKFVVFSLDGELFAVLAQLVKEVVQPLTITALPNSPEWLQGIANLRGEIVPVLDLPKLCRRKSVSSASKTKFIIFRPDFFDSSAAFPVDKISEIVGFEADNLSSAEETYLLGKTVLNSNSVNLLDTEKIFSSLLE
jgi:purine-binding chemotaxis protein CheW